MLRFPLLLLLTLLSAAPASAALGVRISNIADMSPATEWSLGDGPVTMAINVCVFSLDIFGLSEYQMRFTTDTGGFVLKKGSASLPFQTYWSDAGAGNLGADGAQVSYNSLASGLSHANILDNSCSLTGNNARLTIKITQADMTAALGGTYTATLYLTITPP